MAEKQVNYTQEQTLQIVEGYQAGQSVEVLASQFGKSVRSVIAKLSREGVYKAKVYVTKNGEAPIAKDVLADKIGVLVGLSEPEVDSLTKANKGALEKILRKVSLIA